MNSIFSAGLRLHAPCDAGAPRGRLERLPGLRALALSVPLMTTALPADAADLTLFNTYQEITGTSVDIDKLTIVGGQLAIVNNFGLTRAMHRVLGEALLDSGSINLAAGGSATLSFEQ